MRIRYNEEIGTIDIDGVIISANVLKELVDPDRRVLIRFQRRDGIIKALVFSESRVIWIDPIEDDEDLEASLGIDKDKIREGESQ